MENAKTTVKSVYFVNQPLYVSGVFIVVYIRCLQEVGGGCGDWMELAQDMERWRALVSTVMNLRVPKIRGIS